VDSMTADPRGFIDDELARQGMKRHVALTVPDFRSGLAAVADSDLIAAMPRRFVAMHAARFDVIARDTPLRVRKFAIRAVVSKAALMDAGLAWLFDELREAVAA
jgi:DNA-binding transcriptional LysR family regulator